MKFREEREREREKVFQTTIFKDNITKENKPCRDRRYFGLISPLPLKVNMYFRLGYFTDSIAMNWNYKLNTTPSTCHNLGQHLNVDTLSRLNWALNVMLINKCHVSNRIIDFRIVIRIIITTTVVIIIYLTIDSTRRIFLPGNNNDILFEY